MIVDSHCHLYFEQFEKDRAQVLARAREAGVRVFINVGIDEDTSQQAMDLASREEDVWATVGYHPHHAHQWDSDRLARLETLVRSSRRVVAVGESGLDYFKSRASREVQQRVFQEVIDLTQRSNLPLVVHSREAFRDTLEMLSAARKKNREFRSVFHCFSYDARCLEEALREGCHVSFTGNVTFKSAVGIQEAVREVPKDRFMLETDSPYLAPQAVRGKRNEPGHLTHVVQAVASLKRMTEDEVMRCSTANALAFFGVKPPADGSSQ